MTQKVEGGYVMLRLTLRRWKMCFATVILELEVKVNVKPKQKKFFETRTGKIIEMRKMTSVRILVWLYQRQQMLFGTVCL